jgi:hypothetical protein
VNDRITQYLADIDVPPLVMERIESVLAFYSEVSTEEIEDVLVTNPVKEDGSTWYESLWLFSPSYAMEAKNFTSEDDFDNLMLAKRVEYWDVRRQDYEFGETTSESKLTIDFVATGMNRGTLTASGDNCKYLKDIFLKYINPSLVR